MLIKHFLSVEICLFHLCMMSLCLFLLKLCDSNGQKFYINSNLKCVGKISISIYLSSSSSPSEVINLK